MTIHEPDSAASDYDEIQVCSTSQFDSPRFGSVTVRLGRSQFSQVIRMTRADAENLAIKLYEYIDSLHGKKEG